MNHQTLALRRAEMAGAISRGESVEDVAKKFDVSQNTVRMACTEYEVAVPRKVYKRNNSAMLRILHAMIYESAKDAELAAKFSLTRQAINLFRKQACSVGFQLQNKGDR